MTVSFNLAPIPLWPLHDTAGHALRNGYMFTHQDLNRSLIKPVYQDIGGLIPYAQPITFGAGGYRGPFYWSSDSNYYLAIFAADGTPIATIPNYNAPSTGGSTPITTFLGIDNLIQDSQFNYPLNTTFTTNLTTPLSIPITTYAWFYTKDNTSATDVITISALGLGSNPPPNTPTNSLTLACTVAGTAETIKDISWRIPKVESLNNHIVSFSFWAINNSGSPNVSVLFKQNFGTGGAPSSDTFSPITSFTLTNAWAQYTGTVTIPTTAGKTVGTNGNDYLDIIWRFPINSLFSSSVTNMQLNDNALVLPYGFLTPPQQLELPYFDSVNTRDSALTIDSTGVMGWITHLPIGAIVAWPNAVDTVPTNWLPCIGSNLQVSLFPYLYGILGNLYGGVPGISFNLPDYRGTFLRMQDLGIGYDPGRSIGTFEVDEFASHHHAFQGPSLATTFSPGGIPGSENFVSLNTGNTGGPETRPKNWSVLFIMKVL